MNRRAWLWLVFVLVHGFVGVMGYLMSNGPMGDVYLVYEPWSGCALGIGDYCSGPHEIVGITTKWVYPILALVPMILAWAFEWLVSYTPAWAILVTLIDAIAFALLVGDARSRGRVAAASFWLAFMVALGPVGMYRLEGITVPLAIIGCLWLVRRPWWGSVLLAVATWIKVWPAALIAAALFAVRRRGAIIGGAAIVSVVTALTVVALGGGPYLFGFISDQTTRGLQIEAPVSAVYLWFSSLDLFGSRVYYDPGLLTFQVRGPGLDAVIAVMTPLLAITVLAILGVAFWALRRGARFVALFPPLALSLVLALIVVNKVGSPQYIAWFVAPLVFALVVDYRAWARPAAFALVIGLLTQIVYPIFYNYLMVAQPAWGVVLLLTVRNILLVVFLGWVLVRLVRVGLAAGRPRPVVARDAAGAVVS